MARGGKLLARAFRSAGAYRNEGGEELGWHTAMVERVITRNAKAGDVSQLIDILPAGAPTRCTVRQGWMARFPATSDEERAGYEAIYEQVHAAVRDEDFAMLPSCGEGVRQGQHEHMVIGRNEIGVQHMVRVLAGLGVNLG